MKKEKSKKLNVVKVVEAIVLIALCLFILFANVLAAEGFFGGPDEWGIGDTRRLKRICGMIAGAVMILTGGVPKERE